MKRKTQITDFLRGLETTGREDGLEIPAFVHYQNTRMHEGDAAIRPGMQLVEKFEPTQTALTFDGTDDYVTVPLDTRVHTFGMRWTLEILFELDDVVGTQAILSFDHASEVPLYVYMSTSTLTITLKHTGGTTKTITFASLTASTSYALQITRDGDTLYANLNDTESSVALVADTSQIVPGGALLFADDNSSNRLAGTIDYARLLDVVWRDGVGAGLVNLWRRFHDPRARYVLFDYLFQEHGNNYLEDRSRWENHGLVTGSPGTPASLALNSAPVHMIQPRLDWSSKVYLDVIAGRSLYYGEIGR